MSFYLKTDPNRTANTHNWNEWKQTNITYPCIQNEDMQRLNAQVSDEEIKVAIFSINPWKAHGPKGFPAEFYEQLWNIVDKKVCDFFRQIRMNPSEIAKVNQTDICLIPEVV